MVMRLAATFHLRWTNLASKYKPGVFIIEFEDVHAPIGLNIHAETPEEIAVSIMDEIIKVRRKKEHMVKTWEA